MKNIRKKLAREWEKSLFWVGFLCLAGALAWYLSGLLGTDDTGSPQGSASKRRDSLLNEKTAFAFQEPTPDSALRGHNPFAFVHKVPQQATPERKKRPWRRKKPTEDAKPEPKPKPKPEANTNQPKPTPEVASKPDKPEPDTKPQPKPEPKPKPKPKRFIALLYRGIYKSGESGEKQRAFIRGSDSETKKTSTMVVKEGESFAGITVKDFSTEQLVVTGPDGEQQTIALGKQKKIFVE